MATDTFNFVNDFSEKIADGTHDLDTHTFKVALTNTAPDAADAVIADITQIANGNGYTTGGTALTSVTWTESSGTATFASDDVVFTASGGAIATFRYAVLYNDTATGDPLIGWLDYGEGLDLAEGETLTISESGGWFTVSFTNP